MVRAHIASYRHQEHDDAFFNKLTFEMRAGTISCLLGLSGVGKTTLLSILLGLAPGTAMGQVVYEIRDKLLTPREACQLGLVGLLSHNPTLVPWLTIHDNLLVPSRLNKHLSRPSSDDLKQALSAIGLGPDTLKVFPHQLSRGMAQRIVFARSIAYHPAVVFLDEMFTGLDSASRCVLNKAVRTYVSEHHTTCLVVTHDIDQAIVLADHLFYLTPDRDLEQLTNDQGPLSLHYRMLSDLSLLTTTSVRHFKGAQP